MRNVNNPRHKLDGADLQEARVLYEDKGWKPAHIAVYKSVNRSSIFYHINFSGWVRRVPVLKRMPDEVVEFYRQQKKKRSHERLKGTYAYHRFAAEQRESERRMSCEHYRWVKRCSHCGEILESDSMKHVHQ